MTEKNQNSSLFYQKYHLETQIGRGASGICYKIKRISDGKHFALKKISSHSLKKNNIKGAYNEVKILSSLQHPNIIKYIESYMDDQELFIVMQYAEKGDLHSILKKRKLKQQYFQEHELWVMIKQLLQGLEYLHNKNIIHRDVKTLNIFVDQNNNLLIGDLGVSKILKSDLGLYSRVGTPLYLPPEIIKYEKYDFKADIWGLGCVSYLLATLNPPFEGQNIISLGQNIVNKAPKPIQKYSSNMQNVIFEMLEKNHQKRYNASALLKKYFIDNEFLKKQSKFVKQRKPIQNSLIEAKTKQQEHDSKNNEKSFRRYLTFKRIQASEQSYTPKQNFQQKAVHNLRNQKKFRSMIGNFVNDVMDKKQKKDQLVPIVSSRTFQNTIVIKPHKIPTEQQQFKNNNQELTNYKKQTIKKVALSTQNIKVKQDLPLKNSVEKDDKSQTNKSIPIKNITYQKMKQNNLVQSAQCFIQLKQQQQKFYPDKRNNISIRKMTTQAKYTAQTENLRKNKQITGPQIKGSQQFIRSSKYENSKVPSQQNDLFNDIFRMSNQPSFCSDKKQLVGLGRFRQRPKSSIGRKQRYIENSTAKTKRKQNLYTNFYSIIQTQVLKKPEVIIL